jgi:nicotinamidase-related amidase
VEILPDLAPAPGEHVINKHRYSAFFATDLDLILCEWGIQPMKASGGRATGHLKRGGRGELDAF